MHANRILFQLQEQMLSVQQCMLAHDSGLATAGLTIMTHNRS